MLKAKVYVTLKNGVLDPQGAAVCSALHALSHRDVSDVRIGRYIELMLDDDALSKQDAAARVKAMCEALLANTVIEEYRIELEEAGVSCAAP